MSEEQPGGQYAKTRWGGKAVRHQKSERKQQVAVWGLIRNGKDFGFRTEKISHQGV